MKKNQCEMADPVESVNKAANIQVSPKEMYTNC